MMNGIVDYLQSSLQGDADLQSILDLAGQGQRVVESVYPCRVFDESDNGLAMYLTDLPVIGIFPTEEQSTVVDGAAGMKMTFAVQYACEGQLGDPADMGTGKGWPSHPKMQLILETVWWKLRDYLQHPATMLSTYRIEYMYLDTVRYLPPLSSGVYALEASGEMAYPFAPWVDIAAAAPADFVAHDGTITETTLDDYVIEATETAHPWKEED